MNTRPVSAPGWSVFTAAIAATIGILLLAPIWQALNLHVPGEPTHPVGITLPVDAVFYVRNFERGYRWDDEAAVSLPFHPLMSLIIGFLPVEAPADIRFWIASLGFAILAVLASYHYTQSLVNRALSPGVLRWFLVLPGALVMTTSNAEIPCLVFTTLLAMAVTVWKRPGLAAVLGTLAILTKPNALYMVPFLVVTFVEGVWRKDRRLWRSSIYGIGGILFCWMAWIGLLGWIGSNPNAYWDAREIYSPPLDMGPLTLIGRFARTILNYQGPEQLRYVSAFSVPFIDMFLLLSLSLKSEFSRMTILAGLVTIAAIAVTSNNANKVLVYAMTYPGHISIGLLFFEQTLKEGSLFGNQRTKVLIQRLAGIAYLSFCLLIALFFIFGTPLQWYY